METVVVCLGLAAAAYAQDASKSDARPLIQGVILEAGTNRGLPGAQILLSLEDSQAVRTTTSDSQGVFRFEPDQFGHFDLKVKMEGYRPVLDCMILPCPEPTTGSLQTLEGRAVAAEGAAPPPLDHLLVWVQPVDLRIASGFPHTPDEQGSGSRW
jgi:hypothetical protein